MKDRSIDKNDSYLKDELKTKNIIITTLLENQKLLSNSSISYKNQNANNDTNINRSTESKFEMVKDTASNQKNVSSKKLELKNRFDALTLLENKEVHGAPYISMEKNSPTTNSQSSTKPKNHTQNKGKNHNQCLILNQKEKQRLY